MSTPLKTTKNILGLLALVVISTASPIFSLSESSPSSSNNVTLDTSLSASPSAEQNDTSKIIGLSLAVGSGFLIGASFVFKKKGLLNCTKDGMLAGEGHAYLKSFMWWTGMIMMIVGEICNFVAYAFVQPILVTPLGALSVVICAILSSIFLRERLNLQGKVGCAQCIVGATIIVLHAPEQHAVKTIQEFEHYMKQPLFLSWSGAIIIFSIALILKAGPKWGKQHMIIYIGVCSLIGSLSVVATQGLGAAIVHNISTGEPQFNYWFTYFVIVFMVITLLTEINYLNKALNLFNTAMVTPTYYVTFTSTTIITSAIFYQGFAASAVGIMTVCLGFLVICGGVLLLQTSKPAVPVHVHGSSSSAMGTITYEEMEPTAADMRASPFSSIRRITRDLRYPSIAGSSSSAVFQSSPLNPRAESLLQRKRRASNAAQWSRPTSMISHHLAVPGTNPNITAGTTTAFYPSSAGNYSTMVMGPNGAQVRLQLCEIVVSDEKHETTRYQVYRPVVQGDSTLPVANDISEKTGLPGYKHPFLARSSAVTDSRNSSIRFEKPPSMLLHDENEKDERVPQQPQSGLTSGSNFLPPKLAISPPTPTPPSDTFASSSASTAASSSPSSPKPQSGPLTPGGSFFMRPRFRSPSTSTSASADIMEMNDPAHAGRTVVSIEPVHQQPLYSIYVPPPPPSSHFSSPKSVSASSVAATAAQNSLPLPLPLLNSTSFTSTNSNASSTANVSGSDHTHQKELSQPTSEEDGSNDTQDTHDNAVEEKELNQMGRRSPPPKTRRSLFGLGKLFGSKENHNNNNNVNDDGEKSKSPNSLSTTLTSESSSSTAPLNPGTPRQPVVFNRTNHPTRISEGEEEEDTEDILK
ncbi:hypothetical protein BGZ76_004560 [Entomortierella beljakovae]|nr:hypothetical protein BGZ76_004560 [Entomortierella beljakovae]